MAAKMQMGRETVWLKEYDPRVRTRRIVYGLWNAVARALGAPILASAHYGAADARATVELRRIATLRAASVRVPEVLATGRRHLLLADMGPSLSAAIKASDTAAARDEHVRAGLAAIAATHRAGSYLGQPYPRNMTWDGHAVGCIDFEEDPGATLTLAECHARDWLLFCYGVGRHYVDDPARLGALLRDAAAPGLDDAARAALVGTSHRLSFLARAPWRRWRSTAPAAAAIVAARTAFPDPAPAPGR